MKQFIYVLKPIPRLRVAENWAQPDEDKVSLHFKFLTELLAKDALLLAGKTDGLDDHTFGIVILQCDSYDSAKAIMEADPAVKYGVMTAELYPYTIALSKP